MILTTTYRSTYAMLKVCLLHLTYNSVPVSVFGAWLHLSPSRLDIFRDHVAAIPRHQKLFVVDFYMTST